MNRFLKFGVVILILATLVGCQTGKPPRETPNLARTEHIYATRVKYTAENDGAASYLEIAKRSDALFRLLESHVDAFVMDAYNYQIIDHDGTPLYMQNKLSLPIEIDAGGFHIRVSPNYFKFNPIETADGGAVENHIDWDEHTLNLLVPERQMEMENEIITEYLNSFYFEKVQVDNIHREEMGLSLLETPLEDLRVNIIYVKDGQEYFTYRTDLAANTDSVITDPIVSVYTRNIHVSYAHSFMTQFVYFYSEAGTPEEAYHDILTDIQQAEAENSFQKVSSVKENFS